MPIKRIRITIYGRVQGVGFRYFTQAVADQNHITGWVRNTPDGNVECEVQGDEERLALFVLQLEQGPPLSHVKSLYKSDMPVNDKESGFDVRY